MTVQLMTELYAAKADAPMFEFDYQQDQLESSATSRENKNEQPAV